MGTTRRTKRIGALIQAELGDLLLRKIKDPRLAGLSITEVDVSPDMSQAKVFYSLLQSDSRQDVEKVFKSAAGFLRRELSSRLQIKVMPRLIPVYDESLARGARMSQLISDVRSRDEKLHEADRVDDGEDNE